MNPSTRVVIFLCMYPLLEAVFDTRPKGKPQAHRHHGMMLAVVLTLVTAVTVLHERGY